MDSLLLLIPVSLIILCLVIWLFIWAVNNKQFEDLEKHGHDIIFDNDDQYDKQIKDRR
jgi:cbb3-type cytochrome oxidase maturation protein